METTNSDILTVDETAELLKIPRSSVYKLAQEGKIPAQKVGRHWRFYRPNILKWIAGQISFENKPAIPLDWTWVKGSRGHRTVHKQKALLSYVHTLIPADQKVLRVGDAEFGEVERCMTSNRINSF